ncbi:PREDICTED: transmembrane protein 64 [Prunus mume]|uniref:Transmembrane protein 64 n=1 Tax=Prunus mume TaxID=102107 RepID=A0ABM0PF07_PRUMU|nr:PREDICTED: transmembrane protein 64 [Prunus mume]
MTYDESEDRGEVVPELILRIGGEDDKRDYVKLRGDHVDCGPAEGVEGPVEPSSPKKLASLWYWVRLVLLVMCLGLLAGVFVKWVGPFFMDKEIIPIITWETKTFSTPVLAVLVFASVALFPTLLLPSSPSMWVAGMTFGYGYGFLLIMSAATVGVSLPFFLGSLFYHKIQGWLEKYPKRASVLRSAGEGNWFNQFRAVTLIRISPFPYIIYNYCAVATNVKYVPYLLGSLVGMVPETFVAIYTGILIRTLADASHEHHGLSAPQIIFTVVGFSLTVATTIFFTVYAKRQLKELQKDDEPLLQ